MDTIEDSLINIFFLMLQSTSYIYLIKTRDSYLLWILNYILLLSVEYLASVINTKQLVPSLNTYTIPYRCSLCKIF